jgi:hypothetical protein
MHLWLTDSLFVVEDITVYRQLLQRLFVFPNTQVKINMSKAQRKITRICTCEKYVCFEIKCNQFEQNNILVMFSFNHYWSELS